MKKSVLIFSFAFMAIASIAFTACKNTPKATENADATEATEATDKMAVVEYQCPMKCEGDKTYAEMGKCPECGMDLKALAVESAMPEQSHEGHNH